MAKRAAPTRPGRPLADYACGSPPGVDVRIAADGGWYVVTAQRPGTTWLGSLDGTGPRSADARTIVLATRDRAER